MNNCAAFLYRFRFFTAAFVLALTVFFASFISMDLDNSISSWFSPDDPVAMDYNTFKDTFEGSRYLIAAIRSDTIFTDDILSYISLKTVEFEAMDQVKQVYSLANANKIRPRADGIEITPVLDLPEREDVHMLKQLVLTDELFTDYLVAKDGTLTTIILAFDDMDASRMGQVITRVKNILAQDRPDGVETLLAGDFMVNHEFNIFSRQNQTILPALGLIIVIIIITALFRSFSKNLIIISVIAMSLCWTLGFHSLLGYTFNAMSGMIIPLIIILSISNSIHMIEYFEQVRDGSGTKGRFIATIAYITLPCLITSITTSLGLVSLATSPISSVRHFGITSAAGIIFAFIISIFTVPLMLTFIPAPKKLPRKQWGYMLEGLSRINEKHYRVILVITVFAIVFSVFGIKRVKIETNEIDWFPKDSPIYLNSMVLDEKLAGIGDMELIIEVDEDMLKEPEILKRIDTVQTEIESLLRVKKVISLADYVKTLNMALQEGDPRQDRIPESRELIAQEILLMGFSETGREELDRVVNNDFSKGRISIKSSYGSSEETRYLSERAEQLARDAFAGIDDVKISITGTLYMMSMLDKYIIESQIKSFSLAFFLVFGVLFLILRSFRYGLLTIVPNMLPIMLIIGIMGWAGISLNVGTVMISCVALGIAVDDTIHFLSRFRKEYAMKEHTIHSALREAVILAGRALIFTSLITVTGFSVVLFSDFQPSRDFGLLLSLTLFIALISDLFVLPSIMIAAKRFFTKESPDRAEQTGQS